MKKMLFLVPVAAIALASCSSDEAVSQSPAQKAQELTLRPAVQGATRSIITDANFTEFTVKANVTNGDFWKVAGSAAAPTTAPTTDGSVVNSFTDNVFKNGGKWDLFNSSTEGYKWYWSSKNANGTFQAYNQAAGTFKVEDAIAAQKDVLVAYNEGTASEFTNGVPLLFRHVLSQIVIKADNKDADVRQIKVAGVRLHNINSEATLTLPSAKTTADAFDWATTTYAPWGTLSVQKKYTYYKKALGTGGAVQDAITLNASAQEITFDGPALLLPQTVDAATDLTTEAAGNKAYIDVLVQVQTAGTDIVADATTNAIFPKINVGETTGQTLANQGFAWVAVPVAIDWKPGFKYTYVFHFSKDGIGKVSPDGGEGGEEQPGVKPGTEIVDNPVPLYFTVTIDEWNDADNSPEEKDL